MVHYVAKMRLQFVSISHVLFWIHFVVSYVLNNYVDSGAVQLTSSNFDTVLAQNELVVINFYADWCRFSNLLGPIFDEAADKVAEAFPEQGRVVFGKVDCDQENGISSRFHITKYPTLKVMRNGQPAKREYRGQRSADAFLSFVQKQLEDPIHEFKDLAETQVFNKTDRVVIGYFNSNNEPEYKTFRKVATTLKEDCKFYVGFGDVARPMHPPGQPLVVFKPDHATPEGEHETYNGSLIVYDELHVWLTDKCVPLVRQITFENAEELTEEGLPFLILFHRSDDIDTVKSFKELVNTQLISEKQNINFLTADGDAFAHPLHHLGKSQKDLPLIAIDSFRHMYMFPRISDMERPGKLKQFIKDLYSGKLHREYHYGPDPVQTETAENEVDDKHQTEPPESTFRKLGPSKNRYTLLKDEL